MIRRTFLFGSEWLYVKIYSGPKTLENIFVNEITPKLLQLLETHRIDYFFFIRYQDPDYHIRLRLHLGNLEKIGEVMIFLNNVFSPYVIHHIISNVIIDTYSREIERYGEGFIEDLEKVFFFDSLFILNYLYDNGSNDNERWLVSIKYIDLFLERCGFSINEKIDLCSLSSASFSEEIYFNNTHINKLLNLKYRDVKNKIDEVLCVDYLDDRNWVDNLNQYLTNITFFTDRFNDENLNIPDFYSLLTSIIHMHVNRIFRVKQRVNECVIYYLLLKYYKSKKARLNT